MRAKPLSSDDFRKALAQFATGITVVTARSPDAAPIGMTVNSFASVSLVPPLVLWSLALSSANFEAFRDAERQLIHVLAADQLDIAQRFAARGNDKFDFNGWRDGPSRLPLIDGCVAWLECRSSAQYVEGDHVILIGRVEQLRVNGGTPLIFHGGRYVTDLAEAPLPAALQQRS
jgi:flavin reductase (DIM6/NTAB) family NADH-FMN oxidoreductase RutF